MLRMLLVVAAVLFVGLPVGIYGQDASQKTNELVAALDKTKYKKKEKKNFSMEFYMDIKNEAAPGDPQSYAGNYQTDESGYRLNIQVGAGGAVSGSGHDIVPGSDRRLSFTLKDASITGALLTGTKLYENGEQQSFEAVFVNRTVSTGKNVNEITSRDSKFGVGFIQAGKSNDSIPGVTNWTNRVFLERR